MRTNTHTRLAEGLIIGDRYLIGPVIGEGGMGIVYAARHVGLDVPVAFKIIRPDLKDDPEFVQRFLNEARAAASLKGEHIAHVHDVGQLASGEPYLVMEQLEGIGLEAYVRERGLLGEYESVKLVREACTGLAEAHAMMLVHRDIKPANLFLARGADGRSLLKILDFGISKHFSDGSMGLTGPERSLGSPWYMSPEQMMNASGVDQRTDVWSLGVLLFELLTGAHPFDGETIPEVCSRVLTAPTPALRRWKPSVDAELETVVFWCLEKDPNKRCPDVTVLSDALRPFTARALESGAAKDPALAFHRTEPDPKIRLRRVTLGSLAPVAAHLKLRPHRRWTTAVVGLVAAASLATFVWLDATSRQLLRDIRASRLELPWDPALSASHYDETFAGNYELPSWTFLAVPQGYSVSPEAKQIGAEAMGKHREATLTPEEIRRRTDNYRDWLQRQGLRRLEDVAVVDGGTRSLRDEDALDRTGAGSR